ncbi:MAG: hypothetical protein KDB80_03185 [Planctomycetes bacterium]|nr:hypothetical protein [Planctomycetota bacterium]
MLRSSSVTVCFLSAMLSACALAGDGSGRQTVQAGVFDVPAMRIDADTDDREPGQGIELGADLDVGDGFGVRTMLRTEGEEGFAASTGAFYVQTEHEDRLTGFHARAHGGFLEQALHMPLVGSDAVHGEATIGIGVGVGVLDFDRGYDDVWSPAISVRGGADVVFWDHFTLGGSITGMLVGYPGETVAGAAFASIEASVRF